MRYFKNWQYKYTVPMIVMMIFVAGWMLQQQILFNRDVGWLLEASKRLLLGGTYLNDFYENNPPWILYLYSVPVSVARYFSINTMLALQLFVFVLAASSWGICYALSKTIFTEEESRLKALFCLMLAWVLVVLPSREFGQREHLLVILTMPYLLLVTARLDGASFTRYQAILMGLLAGAGFLLKPYFIPALLLIETYYLISQKRWFAWVRPEMVTIIVMTVLYAIVIITKHADYLTQVVPFASRWCGLGAHDPWSSVIESFIVFYSLFAFLFYLATYFDNHHRHLTAVLFAALLGYLLSYLIQQTTWYYHQIPALSIVIMIYSLLYGMRVTATQKPPLFTLLFMMVFIGLMLNLFRMYSTATHWVLIDFFKHDGLVFYISIVLVFIGGLWVTACGSFLMRLFNAGLAVVILVMPILNVNLINYHAVLKKQQYARLTEFINQHAAGQYIYFLTTEIESIYPVIMNSTAASASRFSYFWALGGMVKQAYLPMSSEKRQQLENDKRYFIDMVSEDIRLKKPALIFVDTSEVKNNLYFTGYEHLAHPMKSYNLPFNYLEYFTKNVNFKSSWSSYRYLTTLVSDQQPYMTYPLYQFDVYERV